MFPRNTHPFTAFSSRCTVAVDRSPDDSRSESLIGVICCTVRGEGVDSSAEETARMLRLGMLDWAAGCDGGLTDDRSPELDEAISVGWGLLWLEANGRLEGAGGGGGAAWRREGEAVDRPANEAE